MGKYRRKTEWNVATLSTKAAQATQHAYLNGGWSTPSRGIVCTECEPCRTVHNSY